VKAKTGQSQTLLCYHETMPVTELPTDLITQLQRIFEV